MVIGSMVIKWLIIYVSLITDKTGLLDPAHYTPFVNTYQDAVFHIKDQNERFCP